MQQNENIGFEFQTIIFFFGGLRKMAPILLAKIQIIPFKFGQ